MITRNFFKSLVQILVVAQFVATTVFAGDINWSGRFNFESQLVKNPKMSTKNEYSYFYHHLILNPKIVAADGLAIYTRFDIFNHNEYQNNQFGEFYGGTGTTNNSGITGAVSSETIAVTDLYLTWSQQYGSLIAGRVPVQFGLGATHNAGAGEFDHWLDRKDLIGYKVILGNFFLFPMYGKVKEGDAGEDDDIREYMFQAGYQNFDTDLEVGFFFENRVANPGGNDTVFTSDHFNADTKLGTGQMDIKTYSLFIKKKSGRFTVAVEGSMQDGSTGLELDVVDGEGIDIDGSAITSELTYETENAKTIWDLKAGMVSGDSKGSDKSYEGFLVDKNYDVALIMFNYMLGTSTAFGTATSNDRGFLGSENYIRGTTSSQNVDVGYVTNTIYVAPGIHYKFNDKWGMNGRLTWAQLQEAQYDGQDDALGYELDLGVYHKPINNFTIRLDAGYYMPGDAYEGNPEADPVQKVDDVYGIFTKAALSF